MAVAFATASKVMASPGTRVPPQRKPGDSEISASRSESMDAQIRSSKVPLKLPRRSLLYRRGNFNGTFDDLICASMLSERDAEISLSPGFRWGGTLVPGDAITFEAVANATAMTYPACYRTEMTGGQIKAVLEDVADNIFHPDPYFQGGGDMVRVGGMGYSCLLYTSP